MRILSGLAAAGISLGLLVSTTEAAFFEGKIDGDNNGIAYLGKFVFDSDPSEVTGTISVNVTAKAGQENMAILLFTDEKTSWKKVYPDGKFDSSINCVQARKLSKSHCIDPSGADPKMCYNYLVANPPGSTTYSTEKIMNLRQASRERFWYFVGMNCDEANPGGSKIEGFEYKVHALNVLQDNKLDGMVWDREFGSNERGLNTFFVFFSIMFTALFGVEMFSAWQLRAKLNYMHPIVKTFLVVLFLQYLMVLFNAIHYGGYGGDGVGMPWLRTTADFLDVIARCLFIMLLMLLAKGWTIKNEELTEKKIILGIPAGVLGTNLLILLIRGLLEDPAATDISPVVLFFSVLMITIWVGFAGWFVYTIFNSWKTEDNPIKRKLFSNLAIVYTPWFLGDPLVTLLVLVLDDWARFRVQTMIATSVTTFALSTMTAFLWHSWAEDNFNVSAPDVMGGTVDTYEQL